MTSSIATPLCRRLGIQLPIVQAPIGSATTPALAAAVSEAGALGTLALTWVPLSDVGARLADVRSRTDRPFGVNLVLAFPIDAHLGTCLDAGVRIMSTTWGDPSHAHRRIEAAGATHLHTVGSVDEARQAVDAGVDVVVAQGWEAGGHVRGTVASMPLIPAVVDAVAPRPVIAAGGIADGRGIAAALVLGAQAAWIGTRFLATTEAAAHDVYRDKLVAASADDAVHTSSFDGGWPDAPHRVIRNSTLTAWESAGRPGSPDRPGEGDVVAIRGDGERSLRYDDLMPLTDMNGELEAMALYAGQSVGLVREVRAAGDVVRQLAAEADEALRSAVTDG